MSTKLLDEQSSKKLPWTLNNFEAAHETCIFPLGEDPKTDLVMAFWAVGSDLGSNSRFNAVQYPLGDTNCNATRGHPDGIKMETCWLREPGKYVLYGNKFWLNLVAFVERERMMSFGCWCGVWFVSFSISFIFCLWCLKGLVFCCFGHQMFPIQIEEPLHVAFFKSQWWCFSVVCQMFSFGCCLKRWNKHKWIKYVLVPYHPLEASSHVSNKIGCHSFGGLCYLSGLGM